MTPEEKQDYRAILKMIDSQLESIRKDTDDAANEKRQRLFQERAHVRERLGLK